MEINTFQVVTASLTVVGPILAYLGARHKNKTDLKKLDKENQSALEKLIKEHEHRMEMMELEMKNKHN
ncbi:MAG: hypothetical protein FWE21_00290 [Defluviitaleaceae bacterium]|nr:hypothetical protein [Defluviitaleaceae bacterium]